MFQEDIHDREIENEQHECFQRLEDFISGLTVVIEKNIMWQANNGAPHTMEERIGTR